VNKLDRFTGQVAALCPLDTIYWAAKRLHEQPASLYSLSQPHRFQQPVIIGIRESQTAIALREILPSVRSQKIVASTPSIVSLVYPKKWLMLDKGSFSRAGVPPSISDDGCSSSSAGSKIPWENSLRRSILIKSKPTLHANLIVI